MFYIVLRSALFPSLPGIWLILLLQIIDYFIIIMDSAVLQLQVCNKQSIWIPVRLNEWILTINNLLFMSLSHRSFRNTILDCMFDFLANRNICKVFIYFFFGGGGSKFYNKIFLSSVGQNVSSLALINILFYFLTCIYLYAKTRPVHDAVSLHFPGIINKTYCFVQHKKKICTLPYYLILAILLQLWA